MSRSVYIETTVVSYFTAKTSRDVLIAGHQKATHKIWPLLSSRYKTYISSLTLEEAQRGDREQSAKRATALASFILLDIDDRTRSLAQAIIHAKGVPHDWLEDALHIAVAAVNGIEVLLTLNFAHLNNPFTRSIIRQVIEREGYRCPEICSPDELLEEIL
ncbi:MAG: type II toxin-antitoxin system VapC family toxin [Candidatus Sumerlaeota bacterium]|nr:type II toxin-antitoxin system VapC family toxin [Candidatus Sumerlaeota bacterium]